MEKQLIDALEKAKTPDDIDDVSKAMIAARVINALVKVRKLTEQYLTNIEAVQKEYACELKLGGLAVVLNVTDSLLFGNDGQMCILGSKDDVLKNITQLTEKA